MSINNELGILIRAIADRIVLELPDLSIDRRRVCFVQIYHRSGDGLMLATGRGEETPGFFLVKKRNRGWRFWERTTSTTTPSPISAEEFRRALARMAKIRGMAEVLYLDNEDPDSWPLSATIDLKTIAL